MNLVVYNAGQIAQAAGPTKPVGAAVGGESSSHARRQLPVERIERVGGERVVATQSPSMSVTASTRTTLVPDGKRNAALFDTENPIPYSNKLGIRQYEDIQHEANGGGAAIFLSAVA
jgi:hypothetical protein